MASCWPFTSNRSVCKKGSTTLLPSSSMATPKITKSLSAYFFCSSISQGVSILQGSHQVAQKSTSTALPRKSESFTLLPCKSWNTTSGGISKLPDCEGRGLPAAFEIAACGSARSIVCTPTPRTITVIAATKVFFKVNLSRKISRRPDQLHPFGKDVHECQFSR